MISEKSFCEKQLKEDINRTEKYDETWEGKRKEWEDCPKGHNSILNERRVYKKSAGNVEMKEYLSLSFFCKTFLQ